MLRSEALEVSSKLEELCEKFSPRLAMSVTILNDPEPTYLARCIMMWEEASEELYVLFKVYVNDLALPTGVTTTDIAVHEFRHSLQACRGQDRFKSLRLHFLRLLRVGISFSTVGIFWDSLFEANELERDAHFVERLVHAGLPVEKVLNL